MLKKDFFARNVVEVSKDLLGCFLVKEIDDKKLVGKIVETEAYCGEDDPACHAYGGKTDRNEVMYGEPGRAYVYLIYGVHELLNFVCARKGVPEAVLIRAIEPLQGKHVMAKNRGKKQDLTNGPGKLTEALGISREQNGLNITKKESSIYITEGDKIKEINCSPRIGVEDRSKLRYHIKRNDFVSE
ncbi:DNA-3-methyladenine glycosylase [archaeon SCG-AAA382B04]|nr:DNA-3-methyladenine glycosylase [archaeon SCG-AAA382B04]